MSRFSQIHKKKELHKDIGVDQKSITAHHGKTKYTEDPRSKIYCKLTLTDVVTVADRQDFALIRKKKPTYGTCQLVYD